MEESAREIAGLPALALSGGRGGLGRGRTRRRHGVCGAREPRRCITQRLFDGPRAAAGGPDRRARGLASTRDAPQLIAAAQSMAETDAGHALSARDARGLANTVLKKIAEERVWCAVDAEGRVVFKASLARSARACPARGRLGAP